MTNRSRRLIERSKRLESFESLARGTAAGITADECLRLVMSNASADVRVRLNKAATQISGGASLAFALRDHGIATEFDVELVRLGEQHGGLERIFHTIARRYQNGIARTRRIKGKLLLPAFVLGVGLIVGPLPALTAGAIGVGGYLQRVSLPVLAIVALVGGILFGSKRLMSQRHGTLGDRLTKLPIIGTLITAYSRAEFLERLSLFEQAGYPIIEAVEHTESSLPSFLTKRAYIHIGSELRAGHSLATSLRQHDVFDASAFAIASTGEQGGQLAATLNRIADDARERFDRQLDAVVTWLPRFVYALVVIYIVLQIL